MCVFVSAVNRMLQPTKSPLVSQPRCVTRSLQLVDESTQVNSTKNQRCPEKSTQGQQAKSQRSSKTVNPLTSIFLPGSMAFKNRTSHKFSACLDQALTKVNAGQTSAKPQQQKPQQQKNPLRPSHVRLKFVLQVARTFRMREEDVSCVVIKFSPTFPVYISINEGV